MTELSESILELLSMGPSSFAALYGFLVRNGVVERDIDAVWTAISELEHQDSLRVYETTPEGESKLSSAVGRRSHIERYRAWLGKLGASDLGVDAVSFDPIGIWCQLMPASLASVSTGNDGAWILDCDEAHSTLTIQAATETIAMRVLKEWLEKDASAKLVEQSGPESIDGFRAWNGVEVKPAVRLNATFERERLESQSSGSK